jgi:trimeric autotransporter adhesin
MKIRINVYVVLLTMFGFVGGVSSEETMPKYERNGSAVDELASGSNSESQTDTIRSQAAGDGAGLQYYDTYNTFYGHNAGLSNTTGLSNTFIGSQAGFANTEAWANTFLGRNAGYTTTGQESAGNTFIGYYAGYNNESGRDNTYVGARAGEQSTGSSNSFFGSNAGYSNTTEAFNSFFGAYAGYMNNGGYDNSFFGCSAGRKNKNGWDNSCFGYRAGHGNIDGYRNCYFGASAGGANESGSGNVFFGYGAGNHNEGSRSVFLGHMAGANEKGSDKLYIANSDTSFPLVWGDFGTRKLVVNGDFKAIAASIPSDMRLKKNISPLASCLDKISGLQGVTYEWKIDKYPDTGLTKGKHIGLIAQNVQKLLPELVSEDEGGYKSVSYSKLTAVLVEAIKELKSQNEKQQKEIEELRSIMKKLGS